MNALYKLAGLTKSAHRKYVRKQSSVRDRTSQYLRMIDAVREMHPRMGLAKIYKLVKPEGIGRDAFIELASLYGYVLEPKGPRTTFKGPKGRLHPNLLVGRTLNDFNQVWVTDITYFLLKGRYYYISLIMDLYSRKILAWKLADSLHAKHSLATLRMAIRNRKIANVNQLIHHSDKGTQYTSNAYNELLEKRNIQASMCVSVFENTHMERVNGTIKNDYLYPWKPKSLTALKRLLKQACTNYNNAPHGSLDFLSPVQWEHELKNIAITERKEQEIYTVKRPAKVNNPNQLELTFDQYIC